MAEGVEHRSGQRVGGKRTANEGTVAVFAGELDFRRHPAKNRVIRRERPARHIEVIPRRRVEAIERAAERKLDLWRLLREGGSGSQHSKHKQKHKFLHPTVLPA